MHLLYSFSSQIDSKSDNVFQRPFVQVRCMKTVCNGALLVGANCGESISFFAQTGWTFRIFQNRKTNDNLFIKSVLYLGNEA